MWKTWVGKIPGGRERLPTSVFWPGEFHELYSPWGHKESDKTERISLSLSCNIFLHMKAILWIVLERQKLQISTQRLYYHPPEKLWLSIFMFSLSKPFWWHLGFWNILSWRSLGKKAETGRSPWPLPLSPFFPKEAIKPSSERAHPTPKGSEHPYLWRQGETMKNPSKLALLSFPSSVQVPHTLYLVLFIETRIKYSSLFFAWVFISLRRLLYHVKLMLNKCVYF